MDSFRFVAADTIYNISPVDQFPYDYETFVMWQLVGVMFVFDVSQNFYSTHKRSFAVNIWGVAPPAKMTHSVDAYESPTVYEQLQLAIIIPPH